MKPSKIIFSLCMLITTTSYAQEWEVMDAENMHPNQSAISHDNLKTTGARPSSTRTAARRARTKIQKLTNAKPFRLTRSDLSSGNCASLVLERLHHTPSQTRISIEESDLSNSYEEIVVDAEAPANPQPTSPSEALEVLIPFTSTYTPFIPNPAESPLAESPTAPSLQRYQSLTTEDLNFFDTETTAS